MRGLWSRCFWGSCLVVWAAILGCDLGFPANPPTAWASCIRDDDCEVGSICRFKVCVGVPASEEFQREPIRAEMVREGTADGGVEEPPHERFDTSCQEQATRPCFGGASPPVGRCRPGRQRCKDGVWGACEGEVRAIPETCNGEDDDCDGKIDNLTNTDKPLSRSCKSRCGDGVSICDLGIWRSCSAPTPKPEVCNGRDDDCDGKIDNHLQAPLCAKQKGVCHGARQRCGGHLGWLPCTEWDYKFFSQGLFEPRESRCDQKDNDCDGVVDPPCLCRPKPGPRCPRP